jgi:uncharacterized protein YhaN
VIRISRLDLERWGHFEGRSLAFGDAGALHVVYGPNEAGKSTTRRAVGALLFGVPERTGDTYGRPGADLRIGALLELGSELGSLEVVRRKGRKDTLLDADGEVLDPAPLEAALGGLTHRCSRSRTSRWSRVGWTCWRAAARSASRCSRQPPGHRACTG